MNQKLLEKRRSEILEKIRAARAQSEAGHTQFLLLLWQVGNDPKRAWAAGDDVVTFEQFLREFEILPVDQYRRFAEGVRRLKRMASTEPLEDLALLIGHEVISRLHKLRSEKTLSKFVTDVVSLVRQHDRKPMTREINDLIRALEPRTPRAKSTAREVEAKPDAELERLKAEASQVPRLRQEIERLQKVEEELAPLKEDNARLERMVRLLEGELGRRRTAA